MLGLMQKTTVSLACVWALAVSHRCFLMADATEARDKKTPASVGHLEVCVIKQDLWDHTALRLVGPDQRSLYRSLCQESHFALESAVSEEPLEGVDDLPALLLHWYRTLLKPIVIGEKAAFEVESEAVVSYVISIPLSLKEYELVSAYIREMDERVRAGGVQYVALDHFRTFASGVSPKSEAGGSVFFNCATYVDGALDCIRVPKRKPPFWEAFCTWPSAVIERTQEASQR